jgi:hypothetical protein
MENNIFIEDFIKKINETRNEQFEKFNFKFEDKIIEKKKINENLMEFKNFQSTLKKKAKIEKLKPGNIGKKEYGPPNDVNVDILEDDIFNNNLNENDNDEIKLDIDSLDREKKMELINDFLQRKNIILEEGEIIKIDAILDDPNINLKKYLNISKIYQQIIKIGFIKKLENGLYVVDLNQNKSKKTKNYFFK